jgi:hypothetical protein
MTTIELREKKNNDDPFIKHRFYVAHIKFDRGKWGNFLHVFGPWYLTINHITDAIIFAHLPHCVREGAHMCVSQHRRTTTFDSFVVEAHLEHDVHTL